MTCLSAVQPSPPNTSKNAALGLKAAAYRALAFTIRMQKSRAAAALCSGSSAPCGSSPTHSREVQSSTRRSRKVKKVSMVLLERNTDDADWTDDRGVIALWHPGQG